MAPSPRAVAGVSGMLLVSGLYTTHALLLRQTGTGLGPGSLLTLVLPGILAGHLAWKRAIQEKAEREGVLAGLLMAHFAAALQVCVLILAVLNIDWARYAEQAGSEVAAGVQAATWPAAGMGAVLAIATSYAGCTSAGWLGATLYGVARKLMD